MTFHYLERYQHHTSLVHRLDPRTKLVGAGSAILSIALLPEGAWGSFLAIWIALLLLTRLADLPWEYVLKRSFIVLPFTAAAVGFVFTLPGEAIAVFHIGIWQLAATDAGLARFLSVLLRSWLSVQTTILMITTSRFPDLIQGMRRLGLPNILMTIFSFLYRYLFLLLEEATRLLRARASRSARPAGRGRSPLWHSQIAGNMVGQLFLRSLERSERVYAAMQARGYQGQILALSTPGLKYGDWLALALIWLFMIGVHLVAYLN
jgi:cobalt/nickel transport system permease protein